MLTKVLQVLDHRLAGARGLARMANLQLANTCLSFLSTKEIRTAMSERDVGYLSLSFFHAYATAFWMSHAIEAEKSGLGGKVDWPSHASRTQIKSH